MAGSTYEKIATTTLGSTTNTVSFTSITGAYTDLVLVASGSGSEGTSIYLQYNGDTSTNYSFTNMQGFDGGTEAGRSSSSTEARIGSFTSAGPHLVIAHIMNYSNSTTYKTCISRSGRLPTTTYAFVNLWRSTSAITSLTVNLLYGNFQTGATFTIYGIKAA
jgi:hypothetical protein